jgi:acyl-CoA dehydrogenase
MLDLQPTDTLTLDGAIADVVAPCSHDVDRDARFPSEAIDSLRDLGLMGAAIPSALGGLGLDLRALSDVATRLARGCASTSMVWAMHQIQLGCLVAAAEGSELWSERLRTLAREGTLIASMTSEIGVGGDLRHSIAAVVEGADSTATLEKASPTISYASHAGAILVTARRAPDAAPDDQVCVLLRRDQVALEQRGSWDAMGMRGTVSPGFALSASFDADQIVPIAFGQLASHAMVPWSHILWASCWHGLALEAFARARKMARKRAGSGDAPADVRLAEAARGLSLIQAQIGDAIANLVPAAGSMALLETARLNDLKVSVSQLAVDVAQTCLEICGMAGYQERSPLSIARILRDLYSARLMIGNERIMATNARLALAR